ncbi:14168_t:CDS:2 [Acaulospora colombiana]|uniref:14168_t:CDS:1 n=1 Tax=Acaulospora colombiana TaxID=27376 RepID=A0ACA9KRG5_9GLOM|nr:14168_t:CDS:2 [Acaulospora colombiana]
MSKVGQNNQGRSFQRLGQGLYFTPFSSKAHFYGHGGVGAFFFFDKPD